MSSMLNSVTRRGALVAFAALAVAALAPFALAQQPKVWRHGVVEAKSDAGFVFMAANGGFAENHNLKIEMVQFKGDALALRAMLAGELDSYEGSPGGPMIAASRGADVKIVGCYWPILTYGIFSKPGIMSPKDLVGKSFAISAPGALPELLARAVLEQNNIPADKVRFAQMGSDTDRYKALVAGVVDAASASTEFVPFAMQQNVKLLVHANDAVPKYLRFCIYAGSKTIAQRGDEVARFLAAEMDGLRFALKNRDKAISLTKQIIDAKPDDPRPAHIYDEVKTYSAITPDMPIPLDKLNWMQDLLVKTGNLAKPFDLKTMVNEGPREKALALGAK